MSWRHWLVTHTEFVSSRTCPTQSTSAEGSHPGRCGITWASSSPPCPRYLPGLPCAHGRRLRQQPPCTSGLRGLAPEWQSLQLLRCVIRVAAVQHWCTHGLRQREAGLSAGVCERGRGWGWEVAVATCLTLLGQGCGSSQAGADQLLQVSPQPRGLGRSRRPQPRQSIVTVAVCSSGGPCVPDAARGPGWVLFGGHPGRQIDVIPEPLRTPGWASSSLGLEPGFPPSPREGAGVPVSVASCPRVLQELCLIRFHPATEEEEVAYISLYSYFSSRGRFGVVANNNRHVKDLYLIPLSADDPVPPRLLPFEGPGKRCSPFPQSQVPRPAGAAPPRPRPPRACGAGGGQRGAGLPAHGGGEAVVTGELHVQRRPGACGPLRASGLASPGGAPGRKGNAAPRRPCPRCGVPAALSPPRTGTDFRRWEWGGSVPRRNCCPACCSGSPSPWCARCRVRCCCCA